MHTSRTRVQRIRGRVEGTHGALWEHTRDKTRPMRRDDTTRRDDNKEETGQRNPTEISTSTSTFLALVSRFPFGLGLGIPSRCLGCVLVVGPSLRGELGLLPRSCPSFMASRSMFSLGVLVFFLLLGWCFTPEIEVWVFWVWDSNIHAWSLVWSGLVCLSVNMSVSVRVSMCVSAGAAAAATAAVAHKP